MELNWTLVLDRCFHLAIAYILAVPIGWDRELRSRSAGLRTYPLVAIGACSFLIVGESFLQETESNARLIQGLMGGLGFLGGGAILKRGEDVAGMATAASIWITGSIGMAVALRHYEIAIVLSVFSFFTLSIGRRLKATINPEHVELDRDADERDE